MEACPYCNASSTRVVRSPMNALRLCASIILLPFTIFGGLAGDGNGPMLPPERRCTACGRRFTSRSVLDEATGRRSRPRS